MWAPLQCREVIPKKFQEFPSKLALKARAAAERETLRKSEQRKKCPPIATRGHAQPKKLPRVKPHPA